MSIVRVGSNKQYADGWDAAFGGRKTSAAGKKKAATKKKASPKKKTAKKKSGTKKKA